MTAVRRIASVAPATVTRVSTGDVPKVTRSGAPGPRTGSASTRSTAHGQRSYTRVQPDVWLLAMHAAGGDALRIQVIGPDNVIVHNTRDWKKRR